MTIDKESATPTRSDEDTSEESAASNRIYTVPNIICGIRLIGSFGLIVLAWLDQSDWFLWSFVFLSMTDWIDGKLAILLDQRTVLGARLDSWADAALYAATLLGVLVMRSEVLLGELIWIVPAVTSYALSSVLGILKYRRWPSYHTRAAKTGWFLVMVAVVSLFLDWSLWPLRIAAVAGTVTNLEALLITLVSPSWQADVSSLYHVLKERNRAPSVPEDQSHRESQEEE